MDIRARGKRELIELHGINVIHADVEQEEENFTPVYLNLVDKKNFNHDTTLTT